MIQEWNLFRLGIFLNLVRKIILQILLTAIIASFKKQIKIFQLQDSGRTKDSCKKILIDADFPS